MKTKALIYCRVSSQRQVVDGHGNSSQEQRCRVRAREKNYTVEAVFPDDGVSGGLFDRPAMKRLINYLDEHPIEKYVIIFDDLARFARDLEVHLKLRKELIGRGVTLECLNFNFEDSPEGIFIENVLASKAQLDRQQNRRQVIQKMKARMENGYWPFCLPDGLVNKRDPIHGKIAVSREPMASIYKEAIEKFRDGLLLTPDEVQTFINSEFERKTIAKTISKTATADMLKQLLYTGYLEYPKWKVSFIKARHEGFISLETYNAVQERLQGRTKPWKRRDHSQDFPLRPHVLCSQCETPMTASWNTGRGGEKYPNYMCRKKGCIYNYKTTNKYIFEGKFEALLSVVQPAEDLVDLTKGVLQEEWSKRLEGHTESRSKLASELNEVIGSIDAYFKRISKTNDDEMIEMYELEIKNLKKRKVQIEQELGEEKYTAEEFRTASEKVLNTLKNPMGMWQSDDYRDKRMILFMYFEDQLKYDYKTGFGTADLAYPIRLIANIGQAKTANVEMSGCDPESEKNRLKTSTSVVDLLKVIFCVSNRQDSENQGLKKQ